MKLFGLLFFCLGAASAQSISVGVIGGVPLTDVINSTTTVGSLLTYRPASSNYVVGPALQINLPASLRFEVDALYRPYSFSVSNLVTGIVTNNSADQWQFPFLLQYRIKTPLPVLKPYVEGGVSFDHLANISAAAKSITSGTGFLQNQSNASLVLGGGVDVKVPFVRISGGVRYLHAGAVNFQGLSNQNQAEVLIGVHF